jgi:protein tyrosine/serine phosphatase
MIRVVLLFVFLFVGCYNPSWAQDQNVGKFVSMPSEIFNFHVVSAGIMRGSQPSAQDLVLLKRHAGLKTILSLNDNQQTNEQESSTAGELGVGFINIPMSALDEQGPDKIKSCLDIINDKSRQPIFIHCQAGKDRTCLVMAAYRIKYGHWSLAEALSEMLLYGYDRASFPVMEWSLRKFARSIN